MASPAVAMTPVGAVKPPSEEASAVASRAPVSLEPFEALSEEAASAGPASAPGGPVPAHAASPAVEPNAARSATTASQLPVRSLLTIGAG